MYNSDLKALESIQSTQKLRGSYSLEKRGIFVKFPIYLALPQKALFSLMTQKSNKVQAGSRILSKLVKHTKAGILD